MSPIDFFLMDGKQELLQSFMVPEMSLSSKRAAMTPHTFALFIDAVIIASLLKPIYSTLVSELSSDDELCSCPQDALAIAGYPTLSDVLKEPEPYELVLGRYLKHDWLDQFTWDGVAPIKYIYWLDEITYREIAGEQIMMSGVCFS